MSFIENSENPIDCQLKVFLPDRNKFDLNYFFLRT